MVSYLDTLATFGIGNLPTLDVAVLGALELFAQSGIPSLPPLPEGQLLVVGSVNAATTGRIMCRDRHALFANESDYKEILAHASAVQAALIISASGGKHAVEIAQYLKSRNVRTILITHNANALAKRFVEVHDLIVFPKNREPYTYNVSTYLGVILASTREDPGAIAAFIENNVAPRIPENLGSFDSFFITVPPQFLYITPMLLAKFDELFGALVSGRAFTVEHAKHATTVIPSPTEFFISFGEDTTLFGPLERRCVIPLPPNANYGLLLAVSYYVIGAIQKQHPPYFKENIVEYCKRTSELFGQKIDPIVE